MESSASITIRLHAGLVCVVLLLLGGCASPVQEDGRLRHRQFEVNISALDWLEIGYFPQPGNVRIPLPCRLSFFGTGEIQFKTGRSPQIWTSFTSETEHPHWNEVFSDRLHLKPAEIQDVFQTFVDEGIVPPRSFTFVRKNVKMPYVNIAGMIGMEKVRLATDNPYLVALVEEALENFEPALRRAAAAQQADDNLAE